MNEDQGIPFLVVRLQLPSADGIESLASDLRDHIRSNVERARLIFRSRTLPLPGSDERLFGASIFDLYSLSNEIDSIIFDGISDEAAIDTIKVPLVSGFASDSDAHMRIDVSKIGVGDDRTFETRFSGTILGKYWYRHQEANIFDAINDSKDAVAAHDRGEPTKQILERTKPPRPPRHKG